MERLSGLDATFLYLESNAALMHVCGLLLLDPTSVPDGYSFDRLRKTLTQRTQGVPQFRRKLHDPVLNLDHPVWVDDDEFDIDHHFHRIAVPAPGGREEVAELAAHLAGQPLDRSRPLWEMWLIEGLADGSVAVLSKMHHASVDGVTGASLVSYLCSLEPDAPPILSAQRGAAVRRPSDPEIVIGGLVNRLMRPVHLAKILPSTASAVPDWLSRARKGRAMPAPFTAPRTSFNGMITGHRSVAYVSLPLAEVKEIKNALGATVNDVVMAVVSGALRTYLAGRKELPKSSLVAMVPVSVHGQSTRHGVNKVSGMFSSLSTDIAHPVERLERIAERNKVYKEHHKALSANILQDWATFAAPNTLGLAMRVAAALRFADRTPVIHNLVISNVPGPPVPIYFLGAKVRGFHPLGPVFHGAGLNVTVVSSDGHLDVGLIACRELAPDLWPMADAFKDALAELLAEVRALSAAESPSAESPSAESPSVAEKPAKPATPPKRTPQSTQV
jgi:WS/DGAT/MGAT family acyltransferase